MSMLSCNVQAGPFVFFSAIKPLIMVYILPEFQVEIHILDLILEYNFQHIDRVFRTSIVQNRDLSKYL